MSRKTRFPPNQGKYLSISGVLQYFDIARSTFSRWRTDKNINFPAPALEIGSITKRWSVEDIERWVSTRNNHENGCRDP
jgi:predicted DNA-binding transcriptional regulator AlpA